jgi:hypothetical protein
VTTHPPIQSRRTEPDIAASRSLRNESRGSGGRLLDGIITDVIEMIEGKIGEDSNAQPTVIDGFSTTSSRRESSTPRKACPRSLFSRRPDWQEHHESKAVLSVLEPGVPRESVPIQLRVRVR